jgi:RND family efflux transporter MFP subunit
VNDTNESAINPNRKRVPLALSILLIGGLAAAGLWLLKPAPKTVKPSEPPPPQVAVVYADPQTQALIVDSQGTVEPRREIDLVAQVAGKVQWVNDNFVNGGFFKEGETLLRIDPRDYELALVRAEARVAEAAQVLATEKGRARQAQREWRDLGNAEANELFLRKPQLAAAEAQLEAARADRDKTRLDLERTEVKAPFTGRVREAAADVGQYVSPGSRVARVYDTALAQIRLPLSDRQAALVDLPLGFRGDAENPGPLVVISGTIAGERYQWEGNIVRTDASIDVNNRFYYAVAEVADPFVDYPDQAQVPLVVGLFVDAEIHGREISGVVTVPRRALYKSNKVYTLDDDNRVQLKTVRVLTTDRGQAWIKGDLAEGEAIVVGGQSFLVPGMRVAPYPAKESLASPPVNGDGNPRRLADLAALQRHFYSFLARH